MPADPRRFDPDKPIRRELRKRIKKLVRQGISPQQINESLSATEQKVLGIAQTKGTEGDVFNRAILLGEQFPDATPRQTRAFAAEQLNRPDLLVGGDQGAPLAGAGVRPDFSVAGTRRTPALRKSGREVPAPEGLDELNLPPGSTIDTSDLLSLGLGGTLTAGEALGPRREEAAAKTAREFARDNQKAALTNSLMSIAGLDAEEARQIVDWNFLPAAQRSAQTEKLPENLRFLAELTSLHDRMKTSAVQRAAQIDMMANSGPQRQLTLLKIQTALSQDPERDRFFKALKILPKGQGFDQFKADVVSSYLTSIGMTNPELRNDPSGLAGILDWVIGGFGDLIGGPRPPISIPGVSKMDPEVSQTISSLMEKQGFKVDLSGDTAMITGPGGGTIAGGPGGVDTSAGDQTQLPPQLQERLGPVDSGPGPVSQGGAPPIAGRDVAGNLPPERPPVDLASKKPTSRELGGLARMIDLAAKNQIFIDPANPNQLLGRADAEARGFRGLIQPLPQDLINELISQNPGLSAKEADDLRKQALQQFKRINEQQTADQGTPEFQSVRDTAAAAARQNFQKAEKLSDRYFASISDLMTAVIDFIAETPKEGNKLLRKLSSSAEFNRGEGPLGISLNKKQLAAKKRRQDKRTARAR